MGLLFLGTPLSWEEGKKHADYIREHGITQFLNVWRKLKDREGDTLLWGDEIEYMVVSYDDENKNARLSLRQSEILAKLQDVVLDLCNDCPASAGSVPTFHPEYGRYMLESTPGAPYNGTVSNLLEVERNMRYRRKLAKAYLLPHEVPMTITSFPRLGVREVFTDPPTDPAGATSSHSLFLPEEITNPHARFPTLTANIRRRRGSKVAINVPIYFDTNTPKPFIDPTIPWDRDIYPEDHEARDGAAKPDHIYLDAMGFGMGSEQSRCPSPKFPEFTPIEEEYEEMTMNEIINGKGTFPGLLGVVNAYLDSLNVEFTAKLKLKKYLDLIKRRADGSLQTPATWIRNFVRSHPAYKFDSVVSQEINYDLISAMDQIERGEREAPELLPAYYAGSKFDDGCL
ncbi:unnamed protein product [Rhizoctonia solani]|uniref:Glutamate--cysteine ligase n=1 Tax=Rhizoctonia solani TaxID=456999 RepID=A0A8H3ALJ8_9AGAM|nr:unnamed protein product [Rhizoctonia solani]